MYKQIKIGDVYQSLIDMAVWYEAAVWAADNHCIDPDDIIIPASQLNFVVIIIGPSFPAFKLFLTGKLIRGQPDKTRSPQETVSPPWS